MTKTPLPLEEARELAFRIRRTLLAEASAFSRVEMAGSVRRGKAEVGDIELVGEVDPDREFGATSRIKGALHGAGVRRAPPTTRANTRDLTGGEVEVQSPWGDRYMKGVAESKNGGQVQVDLFVVRPPAEWGVVFLIRTGSAAFSQLMVTRLHRYNLRSEEGHIVHSGHEGTQSFVPCPTEEEFFRLARMPWIPPEHRDPADPVALEAFRREV